MSAPDPIHAAIAACRTARARHIAACAALRGDESDAADRVCNAACEATTRADEALALVRPTTAAGLLALVEWFAEDAEGSDVGAHYLARLVAVMKTCDSGGLFSHPEPEKIVRSEGDDPALPQASGKAGAALPGEEAGVPGLPEVEAAWLSLRAEDQGRIGVAVVDMVFQEFVHGDALVVAGQPEDRAFPDDTPEHDAIRGAAAVAADRRLNELAPLIEGLLPGLFGSDGENPAWCPNPGTRPQPAAAAAVHEAAQ